MTNEEMKLVKFETIISGIWKKLDCFYTSEGNSNPLIILFGDKIDNKYSQIVIKNTFTRENVYWDVYYTKNYKNLEYKYNDEIRELIRVSNDCTNCGGYSAGNIAGQVVFFGLIILAIDNEVYNEKLNVLIDFAFLTGFNTEMINDWIYSVKKILMSEPIVNDELKTIEGKNFFERICSDKRKGFKDLFK